jgi:hypothetical protein
LNSLVLPFFHLILVLPFFHLILVPPFLSLARISTRVECPLKTFYQLYNTKEEKTALVSPDYLKGTQNGSILVGTFHPSTQPVLNP